MFYFQVSGLDLDVEDLEEKYFAENEDVFPITGTLCTPPPKKKQTKQNKKKKQMGQQYWRERRGGGKPLTQVFLEELVFHPSPQTPA